MENFDDLIKRQSEYKQKREDRYKQESRERLSKILRKKVETTMIGALSSIEDHFSFLWNTEDGMSQEQRMMYDIFQKVRSEILDRGNTQARNIDAELSQYEIRWLRYQSAIPVKPQEESKENQDG